MFNLSIRNKRLSAIERKLGTFARDQRGASFIEYVIVVGLVALAAIQAFRLFGGAISTQIGNEQRAIETMGIPANGGGGGGGG